MQILEFPESKDPVIHVTSVIITAGFEEEATLTTWEVLLHLLRTVTFVVIIMIGPDLLCKSYSFIDLCDNCTSQQKTFSFEFYNKL